MARRWTTAQQAQEKVNWDVFQAATSDARAAYEMAAANADTVTLRAASRACERATAPARRVYRARLRAIRTMGVND